MHASSSAFADLPDDQLLAEVTRLATRERQATTDLVASLVVLDARRLYLREGYPSLFAYCTGALHLAEGAAYLRIEAARAARRFPTILDRLAAGAITLTGVKLLAPHFTEDNHLAVLDAARGKSTREIEQLVARLHPRPDVPALVRKLPVRHVTLDACGASSSSAPTPAATLPAFALPAAGTDRATVEARDAVPAVLGFDPAVVASTAPVPRAVVAPLAAERYKVQMTISAETHERLVRAKALLRHAVPDGDVAVIFDRALVLLLERLERQKWGARKGRGATAAATAQPAGAGARKTRRATAAEAAKRDSAGAAARKDRRRPRKGGGQPSAVTAGTTERPGGDGPSGVAACPAVTGGEASASPAAAITELVAKRVRAADGHAVNSQPDAACPALIGGEPSASLPAAITELVAQRVPAADGHAVNSQPGAACPAVTGGEPSASAPGAITELVAQRVPAADGGAVQFERDAVFSTSKTGRRRSRRIPAAVRRAVWQRANGQCTYVSPAGQRCPAQSRLEFHHVVPYVDGGQATVDQITLLCSAHHARETERWFGGPWLVAGGG